MQKAKSRNAEKTIQKIFHLISRLSGTNYHTVKHLKEFLECDENTIYRYFEIIQNIGYELEKKNYSYKIVSFLDKKFNLTEQENKIIVSAVEALDRPEIEKKLLIRKLNYNNTIFTPDLFRLSRQLDMVRTTVYAIQNRRKIIIQNYKTTNPQSKIRDRLVLPLHYDEKRQILQALEEKVVKNFVLERMGGVFICEEEKEVIKAINIPQIDPFGIAGELKFEIELWMTDRATALIKEEYNDIEMYIKCGSNKEYTHVLKMRVAGFEGIGRFVLGMMTEIKVAGDGDFVKYLKGKIENMKIF